MNCYVKDENIYEGSNTKPIILTTTILR